ncbi:MAG: S8 family peptidase [Lachnospiraceae bacterium]|nr:S8 family peptidase [Lachnospiraceae bacterium]
MPESSNSISPAVDENYASFIINYGASITFLERLKQMYTVYVISDTYAIIYLPIEEANLSSSAAYGYGSIPKCYAPMDLSSVNASGITRLQTHPFVPLRGNGVAIAMIDSGIDYTNPLFRNNDGSTRIAYLWDQTIESGTPPELFPFGSEYTADDINAALESNTPLEVLPSRDTDGHGTFLSGIAAGSENIEERFIGVAPESMLMVVKLKPAKTYLRDFFFITENATVYQEDDIMMALAYVKSCASRLSDIALSICLPFGTNMGSHTGSSSLSSYCNILSRLSPLVLSVAGGNEGNARHHYSETLEVSQEYHPVEFRVGDNVQGFSMEFWGDAPTSHSFIFQSPSGERQTLVLRPPYGEQNIRFIFVNTIIYINFALVENQTGRQLILFRFSNPAPGLWRLLVRNNTPFPVKIQLWLPVTSFLSDETYFLRPSPYTTITEPGNAENMITATAYDYRNDSLYLNAGRGFSADDSIVPTLAAPGVDIIGPLPNGRFVTRSGTSIAAAHTCGAAALFLEWSVVNQNLPFINGTSVKNYFIRGSRRPKDLQYPNPEWGYGILDLYNVFESLTTF